MRRADERISVSGGGERFFSPRAHALSGEYLNAETEMSPEVSRYEDAFDFEPDDLAQMDIDGLIAECDIDHTVPPVEKFRRFARGGSSATRLGLRECVAGL